MIHAQAYLPILSATGASLAIGAIWYSDHLFGPMWRKMGGKSIDPKEVPHRLAMHAVASLVTATALFIAISIFQKTQTGLYAKEGLFKIFAAFLSDENQESLLKSAMKTAGFVWLGFIAPTKAIHTIWGNNNWQKFAIEAAGALVSIVAMAAVIAKLS